MGQREVQALIGYETQIMMTFNWPRSDCWKACLHTACWYLHASVQVWCRIWRYSKHVHIEHRAIWVWGWLKLWDALIIESCLPFPEDAKSLSQSLVVFLTLVHYVDIAGHVFRLIYCGCFLSCLKRGIQLLVIPVKAALNYMTNAKVRMIEGLQICLDI